KVALGVTGGPPAAIAPVTVNLSASREASETGSRGNQITVVLATDDCLPQPAKAADAAARVKKKGSGDTASDHTSAPTGKIATGGGCGGVAGRRHSGIVFKRSIDE